MPLEKGSSKTAVSNNIATEIKAGKDPKQAAAIAYSVAKDAQIKGAGVMLITPDDEVLFLLRSPSSNHPNEWDLPGGRADDDETPQETAERECFEEIGAAPYGELKQISETSSKDDSGGQVDFITYMKFIRHKFKPKLDKSEHTQFVWRSLKNPPEPLHPGVRETIDQVLSAKTDKNPEVHPEIKKHIEKELDSLADKRTSKGLGEDNIAKDSLAFDKASVRSFDEDGRLRVELSHISKAMVCPYFGREIPDYDTLGLDADKIYMMLRDPDELKKSVPTWNNVPVLNDHVAVSAKDHQPNAVIGASGSDAAFNAPYLDNSLVIWVEDSINKIESGRQQEISCAYYYRPDMTSGLYEGVSYDGVMRDIRANHIAIVEKGRAGPDVLVGDSINFNGAINMSKLSRKGILVKGALLAALKPVLAQDSGLDLNVVLAGVKHKNWLQKKPGIIAQIKPLLAKDADLGQIVELLDKLDGEKPEDNDLGEDDDMDPKSEAVLAKLRGKISDEDLQEIEAMLSAPQAKNKIQGMDEPPQTANAAEADPKMGKNKEMMAAKDDDDEEMVGKTAMDAAIKKAKHEATQETVTRMHAIAKAQEEVSPYVGKLTAMDSADDVYKAALNIMKVDVKGVHPSAYRAILMAHQKPGEVKQTALAQDSLSASPEMFECFPGLIRK